MGGPTAAAAARPSPSLRVSASCVRTMSFAPTLMVCSFDTEAVPPSLLAILLSSRGATAGALLPLPLPAAAAS